MSYPGFSIDKFKALLLTMAAVAALVLLAGCGPSAQPAAPAPAAGPQVDSEEMRVMIAQAVESSAPQSASPDEIRVMVEQAVAKSETGSSGVTADDLEQVVSSAVSEAMAEQQPKMEAGMGADTMNSAAQEPESIVLTDVAGRTVVGNCETLDPENALPEAA